MITNAETEKLHTWLRREAKQGSGLVTLSHQNVGGVGAGLGRWPVSLEDPDEVLAQLAQDVYRAACDDADGQHAPGPQQYIAHFFGERDLRTPASRMPFLVVAAHQATFGPPGEGIASEPPTPSGFIGHVMRHSDTAWRNAWTITGHALGILERHASQVAQENIQLRQANFELARGYEGLLSERHIRELAAQNALHERNERSQFWNRMWLLAPPVVSKLLSSGAAGGGGAGGAPVRALSPGSTQSGAAPPRALPSRTGPSGGPAASPERPSSAAPSTSAAPVTDAAPSAEGTTGAVAPAPASAPPAEPSGASLLALQLRAFIDSISTEQLGALQGVLSTEQFVALGMIYQSLPQPGTPEEGGS